MNARFARRILLRFPRLFVRAFAPDDRELGRLGEEVAAGTLASRGFRILARGLRTPRGEADLLVERGTVRAVVEVKTGRVTRVPRPRGAPADADVDLRWRPGFRCDARRLARLRSLGRELRAERIDLVEVFLLEPGRTFQVVHHEDLRRPLVGRAP